MDGPGKKWTAAGLVVGAGYTAMCAIRPFRAAVHPVSWCGEPAGTDTTLTAKCDPRVERQRKWRRGREPRLDTASGEADERAGARRTFVSSGWLPVTGEPSAQRCSLGKLVSLSGAGRTRCPRAARAASAGKERSDRQSAGSRAAEADAGQIPSCWRSLVFGLRKAAFRTANSKLAMPTNLPASRIVRDSRARSGEALKPKGCKARFRRTS